MLHFTVWFSCLSVSGSTFFSETFLPPFARKWPAIYLLTLHWVGFLGLWGQNPETISCRMYLTSSRRIQAPTLESSRLKFTHTSQTNWPGEEQQITSCLFKAVVQGLSRFLFIEETNVIGQSDNKEWLPLLRVAVSKPSTLSQFWRAEPTAAQIP